MPKSTLDAAKASMIAFFSACDRRIWTGKQLENAMTSMRKEWGLAQRITIKGFIEYLLDETPFVKTVLSFPSELIARYWWGSQTGYELAASVRPTGYFSHHTAMYLHGLATHEPSVIYINSEQQAKGARQGALQQASIDAAFKKPVRISNNLAAYQDKTISILNGKNTGQLGVISRKHPDAGVIRVTNPARTLIDIAVRPAYSSGISEVLHAYRKAASMLSGQELINVLANLQHAYPYHQAIGFLMEKSGNWDQAALKLFQEPGIQYDFYLDYQMVDTHFSSTWRLHYPAWLDEED